MVRAGVDLDDVAEVDLYLRTRTRAKLGLADLRIKRSRPFGSRQFEPLHISAGLKLQAFLKKGRQGLCRALRSCARPVYSSTSYHNKTTRE